MASESLDCIVLDPQPTYTIMQCSCHWTLLSSSASGTYSYGIAEGVTYFPTGTVGPLLPAVLSPPAQARMGRQSTLNSPAHQKISTKFVHRPNKDTKNSVSISDFWGPCSTVTRLQQWPQTDPYRTARAGQAYVIFPASPLPTSNHLQLRGPLEPDVVCPEVDLSSKLLAQNSLKCLQKLLPLSHPLAKSFTDLVFTAWRNISFCSENGFYSFV